jgi:hypothetical protein
MRLRLCLMFLCLALAGESLHASTSVRSKFNSDQWVRASVDSFVRAARAAYGNDDAIPAYKKVVRSIRRTIEQRRLSEDTNFRSRYQAFLDYIEVVSLETLPDHELGFAVPDKEYFDETRQYVEVPDFLKSQPFLRLVSRAETLEKAKDFLRQLNATREPSQQLLFFSYRSQHLGTPDNDDSRLRLLIVVPGNVQRGVPEKWVQFGVTDPGKRTRIRNLSVVSAMPTSDGVFNSYFKDYFRSFRRDGSITINGRWELGYGDDSCVRCHKSGVLPIFPQTGSVSTNEKPIVEVVNQRFRTYGSPRFDRYYDDSKLGPGLSSATWEVRTKRFGEDFGKTAVGDAMKCSVCHQRQNLGALNWPMNSVIVSSYIKGGQMPFGWKLQESDREELNDKLVEEYFSVDDANPGILKSWLLSSTR